MQTKSQKHAKFYNMQDTLQCAGKHLLGLKTAHSFNIFPA